MSEKQDSEWLRAGNCVYELETYEFQGKQRQRNRWWLAVYGAHTTPQEEVDRIAQQVQAAPDLLAALKYARRFLKPEEHDTAYVDGVIQRAEGEAS